MNISVVIPTYNRYELLKRALASVYLQTHLPQEVIVIDDGSIDDTKQISQDFPNIVYIFQDNAGVSSSRNLGIANATNDWIAFLDSDDEWHQDKLQEQATFHKENPDILMSYSDEKWIRDDVEVKIPKKFSKHGGKIFSKCLSYCIIAPSATIIHKNLLNEVGGFDESLDVCEDYDLWLKVAHKHTIGLVDKKLITKYGGHADQLSFKHWGMDRFRIVALEKLLKRANDENSRIIKEELLKKYTLLLKGAVKYDKIRDIDLYGSKLMKLESK